MVLTFDDWMAAVDEALEEIAGVSSDDLADQLYADWHAEGVSPRRAARMAIEEEY